MIQAIEREPQLLTFISDQNKTKGISERTVEGVELIQKKMAEMSNKAIKEDPDCYISQEMCKEILETTCTDPYSLKFNPMYNAQHCSEKVFIL